MCRLGRFARRFFLDRVKRFNKRLFKDNEISRMRQELQDLKLEKDSSQSKNNVLHKLVGELETRVKDLMASNSEVTLCPNSF